MRRRAEQRPAQKKGGVVTRVTEPATTLFASAREKQQSKTARRRRTEETLPNRQDCRSISAQPVSAAFPEQKALLPNPANSRPRARSTLAAINRPSAAFRAPSNKSSS